MNHLHDFVMIKYDAEIAIEICKECKKKVFYRKGRFDGRIDNVKYLKDHRRDFVQKGTPLWEKYWGHKYYQIKENGDIKTRKSSQRNDKSDGGKGR